MINPTQQSLENFRHQAHPHCISCGAGNEAGLGLEFHLREDNGVEAEFTCDRLYQGYPGFLHGGIASLLLDSAMANCLFAHQISAVTARLIIRYVSPVKITESATVKAWIRDNQPPLYVLEAELEQGGKAVVRASAKFMKMDFPPS
ncbi:MAG: PaaI family thioesterase [Acidobacteria bacterium]|nr:PaaI family thioesterase [Acidobacteriota bacterium]